MEKKQWKNWKEPGYWKEWYWKRGGRDKVLASRKYAEYKRFKQQSINYDTTSEEQH